MSIAVFLGSTLPVTEARKILDATYLPPVSMGDVLAVVADEPRAILIVDGVFEGTPAVWHKEVLFALSRGIPVFGASSMGALRAAELAPFGMQGIGRVFELFRDGVLEDDDEVAVAHASAEHGFRCLSDAMVNIRDGLEEAERGSVISEHTRHTLVGLAKSTFYGERSWARLLEAEIPAAERERLRAFLRAERPDRKRRDAIMALEQLARSELVPHDPVFAFEKSEPWRQMLASAPPSVRDKLGARD